VPLLARITTRSQLWPPTVHRVRALRRGGGKARLRLPVPPAQNRSESAASSAAAGDISSCASTHPRPMSRVDNTATIPSRVVSAVARAASPAEHNSRFVGNPAQGDRILSRSRVASSMSPLRLAEASEAGKALLHEAVFPVSATHWNSQTPHSGLRQDAQSGGGETTPRRCESSAVSSCTA
jgi:hypothetical protein